MADEEIKGVLPKGAEVTINGLPVILKENLHFAIKDALSIDHAAELCVVHSIPVDFSHVDPVSGKQVVYDGRDGSRIETEPEKPAEVKAAKTEAKTAKKK